MKENYPNSLSLILQSEGGYVNDPQDPGGATNKGVTQAVYDDYRTRKTQPKQSVRYIADFEVADIYRSRYWNLVKADLLPKGLDYCVFDFAVNSGTGRAAQFLQTAVDAEPDGKIGPNTLKAVGEHCVEAIIERICNDRLNYLKGLKTWPHFGKGWAARVEFVRKTAKKMDKGQ